MRNTLLVAALLALFLPAQAVERWTLRFFHDEDSSSLGITDLQFATPERGMAVGYLRERGRDRPRPAALATTDGGRTWTPVRIPEPAVSLFLLDGNTGWLVTAKGIFHTTDFGQRWKKLKSPGGVVRVYFRDENRGWAVGAKKSVYETSDGGAKWTRVDAADDPKTPADHTSYHWIAFATEKLGMIAGSSRPPRKQDQRRLPDWMDPQNRPREWPATTILLETRDAGATWKPSQMSLFGQVTRIRLAPDGRGLGLIEFRGDFEWPSEVFRIDVRTGSGERVFRRKDRVVTDILVQQDGSAYLGAIEAMGELTRSPVPGKLKLLRSDNLKDWTEMPVDYRAVGRRVILATAGPGRLWAASDQGMILELESR